MKKFLKWAGAVIFALLVGMTKGVEKNANKATQTVEKVVNKSIIKMSENPNVQRGVTYGGYRMLKNATRSNAQTSSQPRITICNRCYGRGSVQNSDGYVYSCSRCNGTGKIRVR